MNDGGSTDGKRRNGRSIALGIVGAVLGFAGGLGLAPYNRMDPIASGMIALFLFGPMGAVAGAFLGVQLGMLGRSEPREADATIVAPAASAPGAETIADTPPAVALNVAKALFIMLALGGAIGAGFYVLQRADMTPALNPNGPNPVLQFEVRLPAGAPMPAEKDIRASLHERPHAMVWAKMKPDLFRNDGERVVLAGEAELAFATADRQIQMNIAGQTDRTFYLTLVGKPPHTSELGTWQAKADGSEIRYRAKWPGQE